MLLTSAVLFCSCENSGNNVLSFCGGITDDRIGNSPENSRYIFKRVAITKDDGEIINEYIEIADKNDKSTKSSLLSHKEKMSAFTDFFRLKNIYIMALNTLKNTIGNNG